MKRLLIALALVLAAAGLLPGGAALRPASALAAPAGAPGPVPDQYIVVVRPGADPRAVAAGAGVTPMHLYTAALNGFAARLDAAQLRALQGHTAVEYIEQDQEVTLDDVNPPCCINTTVTQTLDGNGDPWGLDRIDQKALPLSGTYKYSWFSGMGDNVRVYIIDTGIKTNHAEFEGRAAAMFDAFGEDGQDCQGHGTHVAGTVGGMTYGVAKKVLLRGVRVFQCSTTTTYAKIIAGVDWVTANSTKPAIVNMSLGGSNYNPLKTAVTNLINTGVFVAVSAGNDQVDACNVSPANVAAAYTVAASDKTDTRWVNLQTGKGSNHGACVDIYAPGASILSAKYTGGSSFKTGTSMAAPHVAGVAALLLDANQNWTPSDITNKLNSLATPGLIQNNPANTPNKLLYKAGY